MDFTLGGLSNVSQPIRNLLEELQTVRKQLQTRLEKIDNAIAALKELDSAGVRDVPEGSTPIRTRKILSKEKPASKYSDDGESEASGKKLGELSLRVLRVVAKKAYTSGEVFEELVKLGFKGEIGEVYAKLASLKKGWHLESRSDEEGAGLRRWYLSRPPENPNA